MVNQSSPDDMDNNVLSESIDVQSISSPMVDIDNLSSGINTKLLTKSRKTNLRAAKRLELMVATDKRSERLELMGTKPKTQLTVERKLKFIRWFKRYWPNTTMAANKVGVTRRTILDHMQIDPVFNEKVQEVIDSKIDSTEGDVAKFAKYSRNFMDRIALLRKNRPEDWDPARRLVIQHERTRMTPDSARSRLDAVSNAIDAEVVQAQFPPEELKAGEPGSPPD